MKRICVAGLSLVALAACGLELNAADGVNAEVATSAVSGALNVSAGSTLALNLPLNLTPKPRALDLLWEALSPVGTALAATWTCTGGSLAPTFAGPGPYTLTPPTCSIGWADGKSGTSSWSNSFALVYGTSCDDTDALPGNQAANCAITRTTGTSGNTRTLTGPDGSTYATTHDTNGANTGWDSSVTPAPTNGGVVLTCGANGCATGGALVINGSHLTGTVTIAGGSGSTIWDHTLTTTTGGLTVSGAGTSRVVNGSVTVQHNLAKFTSTAVFNGVTFGGAGCCFPTSGSVSNSFASGVNAGKSETLSFGSICGEETLTTASGKTTPVTLLNCI